MIIAVENQLKHYFGIIGNSFFLRTVIMNSPKIVISIVTFIYEVVWLWCHTLFSINYWGVFVFWDEVGFYVLAFGFGGFFLVCFFLSFFQMSTLLIFSLNVLNHYLFTFSWADRCIVPMDISWSQSIKLSLKLKDSLNTWKPHSHVLGGVAEWGKMNNLKMLWVTKKITDPKY